MRGATFNLLYGRKPKKVLSEVCYFLETYNLDFMGVQESTDYRQILKEVPGYDYYTGKSVNEGAQTEVGLLVRKSIDVSGVKNKAHGNGWWGIGTGKRVRMKPRNFLQATLGKKYKVGVAHMPANVSLRARVPKDRFEDYAALSKRILRFFKVPSRKARCVMMDGNASATLNVEFAPKWIAGKANAKLSSPDEKIDYIITKGCKVKMIKKLKGANENSDHNVVIFELEDL